MMRFSRNSIIVVIVLLFSVLFVPTDLFDFEEAFVPRLFGKIVHANYTPHTTIVIDGDSDFEIQGWPGNGSKINPYRIEGLNISESTIGLYIQNTRTHFIVRNCTFSRIDFGENIRLRNVTNGEFEDCILPAWRPGIFLSNCSDLELRNCTIRTLSNYGLLANGCNRIEVCNSTIEETIRLYYCNDWILKNNTISGWRAQMISCLNFTIIDNSFIDLGIDLVIPHEPIQSMEYYNHTFQNNKVNGKPLLYQNQQNGLTIFGADFGQIILIQCNETEIRDGYFKDSGIPIQILTSYNCTLEGVSIEKGSTGIAAIRSDRIQILNCRVNASYSGIYLIECNDAKIIGCEIFTEDPEFIYHMNQGIGLSSSDRALVQQNSISDCELGIGIDNSPNSLVNENTIMNCHQGIEIFDANVIVMQNMLLNPEYCGIWVYGNHSVFVNNSIFDSRFYGIYVDPVANNNQFYANQIGWNLLHNAQDFGFNNSWDDGVSIGNSWSDYSGTGNYSIGGTAGSVDHYPSLIMRDSTPPLIEHLSDIFLSSALLNQTVILNWSIAEDYPSSYEIFLNGTSVIRGQWNGSNILFEFEPFEIGTFNITLCVHDLSGYSAFDTVIVHIIYSAELPDYDPISLGLGISIVGIVVVIVLVLKRKPKTIMLTY